MPRPALTNEQRSLLNFVNSERSKDRPIDSVAFGKLMLRPQYVELVRRDITKPADWDKPGDSAGFYETFGSNFADQAPITDEDRPAETVSSSKEGTYDTIRRPAYGKLPPSEDIVFRPSLKQSLEDALGRVPEATQAVGHGLLSLLSDGARAVAKEAPEAIVRSTPGGLLGRLMSQKAPLDAVSGAAAKPKQTRLQKDGL